MSDADFAYLHPFHVVDGAFTPQELDQIESYCDSLPADDAAVYDAGGAGARDGQVRITQTAWVKPEPEVMWLYRRMGQVVAHVNEQVYQFDLRDFSEPFQYTLYRGASGSHYDWHVDQGALKQQRKLSMSVQLSDGGAY